MQSKGNKNESQKDRYGHENTALRTPRTLCGVPKITFSIVNTLDRMRAINASVNIVFV